MRRRILLEDNGCFFTIIDTVSGNTYTANFEEGMTWNEFIDSDYNTINIIRQGGSSKNYVALLDDSGSSGNMTDVETSTNLSILISDKIINGFTYYINYWWCCFVAGTKVLTSLNGATKNIEELNVGDNVISYNVGAKENYDAMVIGTHTNTKSTDMAKITCSDGTVLEMTAYHPLYTKDGWKSLTNYKGYDELVVGDIVKTIDDWSEIVSIERTTLKTPINTYTINVKDYNETVDVDTNDGFYANGILSHNANSPCD